MRDVDLLVFGRKTHQLMVPFWPDVAKNHSQTKAMNEFAQTFDSINRTEGEAPKRSSASGKEERAVHHPLPVNAAPGEEQKRSP
jgi:hypothetical protein